ncbi:MAG: tetratricopeptide repeat protein [Vicinamibacterales bacterium]
MLSVFLVAALAVGSQPAGAGAAPGTPTFARDVAPILYRACTPCHRPGQPTPFSFQSYQDARRRAQLIARVTRDRVMPPWQPDRGPLAFAGERRLSVAEIDLLERWAEAGAPEGDVAVAPQPPVFADGWTLGPPDLVVRLPTPYALASSGSDQLRTFVVPSGVTSRRYVRAIAFDPGRTQAIHHANIKLDTTRSSRWLDEQDVDQGYEGAGGRNARFPDGHFLGWTPGQSPRVTDDTPWRIDPGADLVLELHLAPTGRLEEVQPAVALYFTDRPATLSPYMIRIGRQDLDVPPGVADYRAIDSYTLPVDVSVLALQPHAHNLARIVRGTATFPDGREIDLIAISNWNPRWQDVYRYDVPLRLPRGTRIAVEYRFDNSASNPRNPHTPPARVTFGQSASAEMGDLWLQVTTASADARRALDADFTPKMLREDIAGAEKVLDANPEDSRAHTDLAFCYAEAGRTADALVHLRAAARLAPASAGAHFDLGVALLRQQQLADARIELTEAARLKPDLAEAYANLGVVSHVEGRLDEALAWYARAAALNPSDGDTHYNIGRVHAARGARDEAIAHYRQALALDSDDPATLASLGSVLASGGEIQEAVASYRRAIAVNPDYTPALVDLAWILATDATVLSPAEAVTFAERARTLTQGQSPTVLDTLSMAYAAAGQSDDAIRVGNEAIERAIAIGADALVARIRARLESYRR